MRLAESLARQTWTFPELRHSVRKSVWANVFVGDNPIGGVWLWFDDEIVRCADTRAIWAESKVYFSALHQGVFTLGGGNLTVLLGMKCNHVYVLASLNQDSSAKSHLISDLSSSALGICILQLVAIIKYFLVSKDPAIEKKIQVLGIDK